MYRAYFVIFIITCRCAIIS